MYYQRQLYVSKSTFQNVLPQTDSSYDIGSNKTNNLLPDSSYITYGIIYNEDSKHCQC